MSKDKTVTLTGDEEIELQYEEDCYDNSTCALSDVVIVSRMLNHLLDQYHEPYESFVGEFGDLVANFMPLLAAENIAFEDFIPKMMEADDYKFGDEVPDVMYGSWIDFVFGSNAEAFLDQHGFWKKLFDDDFLNKFYEAQQSLADSGYKLTKISPMDIPAMLAKSKDFVSRTKFAEMFHFSAYSLLYGSHTRIFPNMDVFPDNQIGKLLTDQKEFITKVMLMSHPFFAMSNNNKGLFRRDPMMKDFFAMVSGIGEEGAQFPAKINLMPTDNGICSVLNIDASKVLIENSIKENLLFGQMNANPDQWQPHNGHKKSFHFMFPNEISSGNLQVSLARRVH